MSFQGDIKYWEQGFHDGLETAIKMTEKLAEELEGIVSKDIVLTLQTLTTTFTVIKDSEDVAALASKKAFK